MQRMCKAVYISTHQVTELGIHYLKVEVAYIVIVCWQVVSFNGIHLQTCTVGQTLGALQTDQLCCQDQTGSDNQQQALLHCFRTMTSISLPLQ